MNPFLDALSTAGYVLDTPGAYLRGALAGAPGTRASGRELLQAHGLSSQDDPWGGVKGFGAEMLADPLNLLGGGIASHMLGRGARALSHADDAVPLLRRLGELKAGVEDPLDALRYSYRHGVGSAVPEPIQAAARYVGGEEGAIRPFQEVGRRTDPDYINSLPWWHGTATTGLSPELLDPMKTNPDSLFGRGIYKTADPKVAGGPGGYAGARLGEAGRKWSRDVFGQLSPLLRKNPDLAGNVAGDLLGIARRHGEALGGTGSLMEGDVVDYLESRLRAGNPAWREVGQILDRMGDSPDLLRDVRESLGVRGLDFPTTPSPTVYEANTNLGNILDMEGTVGGSPRFLEAMGHYGGKLDALRQESIMQAARELVDAEIGGFGTASNWSETLDRIGKMTPPSEHFANILRSPAHSAGKIEDIWQPIQDYTADVVSPLTMSGSSHLADRDPLIEALREAGIDALSHTGGLRAGGGRNLHQVLISLDPNDTLSRVGRSGQITRFAPQNIDELLRRYAPSPGHGDAGHGVVRPFQELTAGKGNPFENLRTISEAVGSRLHDPRLPLADYSGPLGDNMAIYMPGSELVVPNTLRHADAWASNPLMRAGRERAPWYFSSTSSLAPAVHEAAHHLHKRAVGGRQFDLMRVFNEANAPSDPDVLGRLLGKVGGEVSYYGRTNPREFVAEAFTKRALGEFDPSGDVADYYNILGGPKVPPKLAELLRRIRGEGLDLALLPPLLAGGAAAGSAENLRD